MPSDRALARSIVMIPVYSLADSITPHFIVIDSALLFYLDIPSFELRVLLFSLKFWRACKTEEYFVMGK